MPIRRWVLTVGALGICATAPARVSGATTTEVEATGYAGDSPGGFACGPSMHARYPGGAARVRVSENEGRFMGSGVTGEVAGSIERQHYDIIRCPDDACDESDGPMPDSWMAGGRVRGGYRFTHFSIEGGGALYNAYRHADDHGPSLYAIPELEIAGGVANSFRVLGGIGSSTITNIQRPGLYIGGDLALGQGELQLRLGAHRAGPENAAGGRADVAGYVPLVPHLDLRLSAAVGGADGYVGGEGGVGLRSTF